MTLELSVKVQIQFAYFHCTYIYSKANFNLSAWHWMCEKKFWSPDIIKQLHNFSTPLNIYLKYFNLTEAKTSHNTSGFDWF